MNVDPAAILALIADLYAQINQLAAENAELRTALAETDEPPAPQ